MPHATMKLIPGIDTSKTAALNEMAFSESQFIRFTSDRNGMGLAQKLGGWVNYANRTYSSTISELHPWQDLNENTRLAVGAADELSYLQDGAYVNITPQLTSSDFGVSASIQSQTVSSVNTTTDTIVTPTIWNTGTPVYFTSTGTVPAPLVANTVYYIVSAAIGATSFQVATTQGGGAINLTTAGTGTITVSIPSFSCVQNSSTITIVDTALGTQSVTFTTVGSGTATVVTAATCPTENTKVYFKGGTLPTGISATTAYYVRPLTSTTFNLALTAGGAAITTVTTAGSSVTMYAPDQIKTGFSINLNTPISFQGTNIFLNGFYQVTDDFEGNNYFSVYTISAGVNATASSNLPLVPTFTTASGTSGVLVTEYNHPYYTGVTVNFAYPTTQNGVTISGNYPITLDSTFPTYKYNINASTAATATGTFSMNGGLANIDYYYNRPSLSQAGGYGSGGYGSGGYGIGTIVSYPTAPTLSNVVDWTINNFGEVLIANPQGGPIYYWDPTGNTSTAQLLYQAPAANRGILIAMPSRQVVAYGSTATGEIDPLLIRWSDAEDATVWTAAANNLAGSYRIPEGSTIVGAIQGPQQVLIWTDLAIWSMQFVGGTEVWGFNKLSDGVGLIGKKAMGLLNGGVFWMSPNNFNVWAGGVPQSIPCPVWDQVFQNLNRQQVEKIRCATNSLFNEVTWYYPSASSSVNDLYVKYNTSNQQWDYGSLGRTAWTDQSILGPPIGAGTNNKIYQHEIGYNDDTDPLTSYFQTGYMQLNEADSMIFIDQIWPDFKWHTVSETTTPATVYLTFYGTNYPGDTPYQYGPYEMTQSSQYLSVRIRHRLLSIRITTANDVGVSQLNAYYRIGALRYRFQPDGRF